MTRLELTDDGWADLYAPRKVPERKRHTHDLAIFALNEATSGLPRNAKGDVDERYAGPAQGDALKRVTWTLILALVRDWSYGPVNLDVLLDEVPGDAYDILARHCEKLWDELNPDFQADFDPKALSVVSPSPPPGSSTDRSTFATVSPDGTF